MARRTAEALINPELLVWARESANLTIPEAASKVQVAPERLEEWESGNGRPSIAKLRELGRVYHRPIAIFYLPRAPKTFMAMRDFRRLSGTVAARASYQLQFEMRRAHDRREIALELLDDLGERPPRFVGEISAGTDPDDAAALLRGYIGVGREEQLSWRAPHEALNAWRTALEHAGLLVFQAFRVDLEEMRGFSIAEDPLPVIVVNSADTPLGRTFSLAHELAHVALRRGGVCDMVDDASRSPEEQSLEVFCNRVAASVLLPADWILQDTEVRQHRGMEWSDTDIRRLARRYSVSREAFVRRLLTLRKTDESFYRRKREELIEEYRRKREEQKGFAPPDAVALARAGDYFTRVVLDSYHREYITSADVADYLDVKLKHLDTIERASIGLGAIA